MVRKSSRGISQMTLMEVAHVGVMTRARAASLEATTERSVRVKTRKVRDGELVELSSSYVQLRKRQRTVDSAANSEIGLMTTEVQCSSPSLDLVQTSCCSSNGFSELDEESIKFVDPKNESADVETSTYYSCRERREMSPSSALREESESVESTPKPTLKNSQSTSMAAAKMPSVLELDEFFAAAEKETQKQFADKYNYDIVKDIPLEGRYEWVRLKP